MRVVNWNIHGAYVAGKATHEQQVRSWHHLAALGADLALVQEAEGGAIPDWAHEQWDLLVGEVGVCDTTQDWGSVIAARPELNLRPRPDLIEPGSWLCLLYDYVIVGEIDLPDGSPALVASVHAPACSARDLLDEKLRMPGAIPEEQLVPIAIEPDPPWTSDVVFHALDRAKTDRFLFGGDWNLSRLWDEGRTTPTNALFFARAVSHGWADCHSDRNEEQSFFREGGRPHQLDHLFCDGQFFARRVTCSVWADPVIHELSDHAPLVTDFDFDFD